jgi:hypothetical protein
MLGTMALNADIDVRQVLPAIRVAALVVHARQDRAVPIEHGRYLAANIPGDFGFWVVRCHVDAHFVLVCTRVVQLRVLDLALDVPVRRCARLDAVRLECATDS